MEMEVDQLPKPEQVPTAAVTSLESYKAALLKSGIEAASLLTELMELKMMPDPRAKEMAEVAVEVLKLVNSFHEEN